MKNIFISLFLLLAIITPAFAQELKFSYEPVEDLATPCTHKQIRDLPDWEVTCGEKTFTAHVIVRQYKRETTPKSTLEVLYWVTEPGETPTSIRKFHSTTGLIRFNDSANFHSLDLSQGIENDMASLHLELKP